MTLNGGRWITVSHVTESSAHQLVSLGTSLKTHTSGFTHVSHMLPTTRTELLRWHPAANHSLGHQLHESPTPAQAHPPPGEMGRWRDGGDGSQLPPMLSFGLSVAVWNSRGRELVKKITVTCLAAISLMRPGFSWINRHVLLPGVPILFFLFFLLHEYSIPSAPLPAQQPVTLHAGFKNAATLPICCGAWAEGRRRRPKRCEEHFWGQLLLTSRQTERAAEMSVFFTFIFLIRFAQMNKSLIIWAVFNSKKQT